MTALRPYGQHATLIDLPDPGLVGGIAAAAHRVRGVVEVVPGASTVLVRFTGTSRDSVDEALAALEPEVVAVRSAQVVLPVRYDGADLAAVAAAAGLDVDAVVALHSSAEYTVRFCGFAPGFAYLDGLDPRLRLPRLASPRTSVPAGSVAVAAEFTGVYPRSSPGGWHLLGRTDAVLWDADRDPPALLSPGTRVRFEAT